MASDLVENVACAMCAFDGLDPDEPVLSGVVYRPRWDTREFKGRAKAAIDEIERLRSLAGEGDTTTAANVIAAELRAQGDEVAVITVSKTGREMSYHRDRASAAHLFTSSKQGMDREAVARIIDPASWSDHDHYAARLRGEGVWPDDAEQVETLIRSYRNRLWAVVADSFLKADAILALASPAVEENGGALERWSEIRDDPDAIVACGDRWKAVATKIGCQLNGFDDGFTASFITPDGSTIQVGPKFRATLAALSISESCTCHPDDKPVECQKRYAASECQAAVNDLGNTPAAQAQMDALEEQHDAAEERLAKAREICARFDPDKDYQYLEGQRDDYMPMTAVLFALGQPSMVLDSTPPCLRCTDDGLQHVGPCVREDTKA